MGHDDDEEQQRLPEAGIERGGLSQRSCVMHAGLALGYGVGGLADEREEA